VLSPGSAETNIGEVGNSMFIWWQVVSEIFVPKNHMPKVKCQLQDPRIS